MGSYVILPTSWCSVDILSKQLTFVTRSTNFLGGATNSLTITNSAGFTNAGTTLFISQSLITYFTNQAYVVLPVVCVSNNVALFQGVDQVRFERRDFDSLLGRFFQPFTNFYTLNSITNSVLVPQRAQRVLSAPDFLMSATDLAPVGGAIPTYFVVSRNVNFNTNFEYAGLAGPGTIESSTTIAFNKVGVIVPSFSGGFFANDTAQGAWGSFDGTTNAPVVYPNGTSLLNLENQVLIGISPAHLSAGQFGVSYGNGTPTFTGTGGASPYTWSLAPNSPGLPPGLFLAPNGTISGTPTAQGTFDFTIRLTDAGGRTVDRPYSITIL